jgi:hypothetical protein
MKVRESAQEQYGKTGSPGPPSRLAFRKLKIESEGNMPLSLVLEKERKGVIVLTDMRSSQSRIATWRAMRSPRILRFYAS